MDIETNDKNNGPNDLKTRIPVVDGTISYDSPLPEHTDAYKKLIEQSDNILALLDQSEIVEDGQGSRDIPEDVAEMGDSVAATVDFDGRIDNQKEKQNFDYQPQQVDIPSADDEIVRSFENNANIYDHHAREKYISQIESERPYLLQRQQQLESELETLRKTKQTYEDEEIKSYENAVVEGIKNAHDLGEIEKQTILLRELNKIDRLKEERKKERSILEQMSAGSQPQYTGYQQNYVPQVYPPQQPVQSWYGQPQSSSGVYPVQQMPPQYQQTPQAHQQYQHPLTSHMPTQPSSSAPRTAVPSSASTRIKSSSQSSIASLHPFQRSLLENHPIPKGMSKSDYEAFAMKISNSIKDK
jgi:hypothetical protein